MTRGDILVLDARESQEQKVVCLGLGFRVRGESVLGALDNRSSKFSEMS